MSKVQIRQGVFETNSSSTHSITMVDKSDYEAWKKGEVLYNQDTEKFLPVDEAIEENIKKLRDEYIDDNESETFEQFASLYRTTKSFDDAISGTEDLEMDEDDIDWYEMYMDYEQYDNRMGEYYETYVEYFTTKSGDEVVAFGYYGNDY